MDIALWEKKVTDDFRLKTYVFEHPLLYQLCSGAFHAGLTRASPIEPDRGHRLPFSVPSSLGYQRQRRLHMISS